MSAPRKGQGLLDSFATVSLPTRSISPTLFVSARPLPVAPRGKRGKLGPERALRLLQRNTTRGHYRGIGPSSSKSLAVQPSRECTGETFAPRLHAQVAFPATSIPAPLSPCPLLRGPEGVPRTAVHSLGIALGTGRETAPSFNTWCLPPLNDPGVTSRLAVPDVLRTSARRCLFDCPGADALTGVTYRNSSTTP